MGYNFNVTFLYGRKLLRRGVLTLDAEWTFHRRGSWLRMLLGFRKRAPVQALAQTTSDPLLLAQLWWLLFINFEILGLKPQLVWEKSTITGLQSPRLFVQVLIVCLNPGETPATHLLPADKLFVGRRRETACAPPYCSTKPSMYYPAPGHDKLRSRFCGKAAPYHLAPKQRDAVGLVTFEVEAANPVRSTGTPHTLRS